MKGKKKYAEKFVGATPTQYEEFEDRHKKVIRLFSDYKFNRILDVGCGDGNFSVLLKQACGANEVCGIEVSEKGVESARRNGVKAFQADMDEEDFPFEDEYFDAVFAGEIIEHLFDPDHFLDEVYRVLRKEAGILILSTPNLASIHNRIALLLGFQPFPTGVSARVNIGRIYEPDSGAQSLDHIRVLTLRSLKELLKIHSFKIIKVKGSTAMLPKNMKLSSFIRSIDQFFTLFPSLSYRAIVVAQSRNKNENSTL